MSGNEGRLPVYQTGGGRAQAVMRRREGLVVSAGGVVTRGGLRWSACEVFVCGGLAGYGSMHKCVVQM